MIKFNNIRMFRLGKKIGCLLPRWLVIFLAQCLAFERFIFAKREKEQVRKNLQQCRQNDSALNVFRVFRNYAICMADILRIPIYHYKKLADLVSVKGLENLDKALSMNQGVILTTGHIGNWDLAGVYLSSLGYKLSAVVEDIPDLANFFNALRSKTGMQTLFPHNRDEMIKTLVDKRILVLVSDRNFSGCGIKVNFLDSEKTMPVGSASFAVKHKAPVVVGCFVLNNDKKTYRVEISEPILSDNKTYKELTQQIANTLSYYIKQNPFQWFVLQDEQRSSV